MATIKRQKASSRNGSSRADRNGEHPRRRTDSLWARYRRSRGHKARNELVERYRGIVDGMAAALAARLPRRVDVQDLAHAGMWGLMRAIENFEPDRGIEFVTFMRIRVRGAMLDELRTMDYLPRLARHRRRVFDAAQARLREALQRAPSDAELAEALGVPEATLWRRFAPPPETTGASRLRGGHPGEADQTDGLDELVDHHVESPLEALNRQDLLGKIEASLQPIEWKVLKMHYLDGMSGKEVARKLRLSASRICQIHGRVLSKLKTRLGGLDAR